MDREEVYISKNLEEPQQQPSDAGDETQGDEPGPHLGGTASPGPTQPGGGGQAKEKRDYVSLWAVWARAYLWGLHHGHHYQPCMHGCLRGLASCCHAACVCAPLPMPPCLPPCCCSCDGGGVF
jgi:hypothetical protein